MTDCYFHLKNVPFPITNAGMDKLSSVTELFHVEVERRYFSAEFVEWVHKHNLVIWGIEVFVLPPNSILPIHSDCVEFSNKGKLNWAFSNSPHYNTWYTPNQNWKKKIVHSVQNDGNDNGYCYEFEPDEVIEIARTTLENPTIIQSGIPHSAISTGDVRRSISVSLLPKNFTPPNKDWGIPINELKEIFKKNLKSSNNIFRHLDLNIEPVVDLSILNTLPDAGHVPLDNNVVNPQLIEFMYSRGIILKNTDVFCSPPGFELGIHVDGVRLSNNVAINWAYCEKEGSVMQWWKPKDTTQNKIYDPSKHDSAYGISTTPYALGWEKDEVDFIGEVEVRKPTLVNIGIPHGMNNKTDIRRKAISTTWLYNGRDLQWDDAVDLLQDIIHE
jgi:hypothetical protein